jgi:hypothetical protein
MISATLRGLTVRFFLSGASPRLLLNAYILNVTDDKGLSIAFAKDGAWLLIDLPELTMSIIIFFSWFVNGLRILFGL